MSAAPFAPTPSSYVEAKKLDGLVFAEEWIDCDDDGDDDGDDASVFQRLRSTGLFRRKDSFPSLRCRMLISS